MEENCARNLEATAGGGGGGGVCADKQGRAGRAAGLFPPMMSVPVMRAGRGGRDQAGRKTR